MSACARTGGLAPMDRVRMAGGPVMAERGTGRSARKGNITKEGRQDAQRPQTDKGDAGGGLVI